MGIPTVQRAVLTQEEKEKASGPGGQKAKEKDYVLLVEGTDLRRVMATDGEGGRVAVGRGGEAC